MITTNEPPTFPIGEFDPPGEYGVEKKAHYAERLRAGPAKIRQSIDGLDQEQLNTVYKNWSIRQIVHHLADSRMNAYIRFKWALTEASPLIKSYDETKWSELVDARESCVEPSLIMLDGLHARWATLVEHLTDDEMIKTFFHPEIGDDVSLYTSLPSYIWHTDHHVGQIMWLRERME